MKDDTVPDMLASALWYAKRGFAVFPVHEPIFNEDGKCVGCTCEEYRHSDKCKQDHPHMYLEPDAHCEHPGKCPRVRWRDKSTTDAEQITRWWRWWPGAGIGIDDGKSGMLILDADLYKDTYAGNGFVLDEETPTSLTGGGGTHLWYRQPDGKQYGNAPGDLPDGIDIRGMGGYHIAPPSLHKSGRRYAFESGYAPNEIDMSVVPTALQALLDAAPQNKRNDLGPADSEAVERSAKIVRALLKHAELIATEQEWRVGEDNGRRWVMADCPYSDDHADGAFVVVYPDGVIGAGCHHARCQKRIKEEGGSGWKLLRKITDFAPTPILKFRNGAGQPATFVDAAHLTDMGNAQRMHAAVQGQVLYVPQFDRWYTWHGTHWQEDDTFEIVRLAKEAVRAIYAEAAATDDDDQRKKLIKWGVQSENRSRVEAMLSLLRSEPDIAVRPADLDQHPMYLACTNGTLDLTTGDLMAPDSTHLLTRRIEVAYDPAADCPIWERFLLRVMDGDMERVSFLQRLIGHALTGDTTGKYLVFMYGPKGNNGKSTMVEIITRLLGPYALKSPTEMIMTKAYRGGIPNDIARLRGVRFTVTNEVDEGMMLSESVVKDLTGNDTLTARFMRAEFFDFRPTHKLWIYGNHRPEIKGTDPAIWDRVKLIPFDVEIPPTERDPLMVERLAAELPGILAWAVRGNFYWRKMGLATPAAVKVATADYQREQDTIGQFLSECCALGANHQINAGMIYQAYEGWAKQLGLRGDSGTKFGADLTRRGFSVKRERSGKLRIGLDLNTYGRTFGPSVNPHWTDD